MMGDMGINQINPPPPPSSQGIINPGWPPSDIEDTPHHSWFMWCRGPNPCLHACLPSALPTVPQFFFFFGTRSHSFWNAQGSSYVRLVKLQSFEFGACLSLLRRYSSSPPHLFKNKTSKTVALRYRGCPPLSPGRMHSSGGTLVSPGFARRGKGSL